MVAPPPEAEAGDALTTARRAVQWVASCFQLIALHAARVDDGCYLWELVHPQEEGVPVVSPTGKYAVKLWELGAWRLVVVDDRIPCDAGGAPLLPRSTAELELWPLLLAKGVCKLAAATGTDVRDLALLRRLTGWLPQAVPISPTLPEDAAWALCAAKLAADVDGDTIAALLPKADADAAPALADVGLAAGPLLPVLQAATVPETVLTDGARAAGVGATHFLRLHCEVLQWGGQYRDTDEDSWTAALATALGWKRWQRLRIRAAGLPLHDFWLHQASINAYFGSVILLHRPAAWAHHAIHTATATLAPLGGAAPILLQIAAPEAPAPPEAEGEGGEGEGGGEEAEAPPPSPPAAPEPRDVPVVLALQTAAAGATLGGSLEVQLQRHTWVAEAEAPTLVRVIAPSTAALPLMLRQGEAYRVALRAVAPDAATVAAEAAAKAAAAARAAVVKELFAAIDTSGNGKISREEYAAAYQGKFVFGFFEYLDGQGVLDGEITEDELLAGLLPLAGNQGDEAWHAEMAAFITAVKAKNAADSGEVAAAEAEAGGEAAAEAPAAEAAGEEAAGEEAAAAEEEAAPPVVQRVALSVLAQDEVSIGELAAVSESALGLCVQQLKGTLPAVEAGAWSCVLAFNLQPTADCVVSANLSMDDPNVAACARLHVIDDESAVESSRVGLATGEMVLAPSERGTTLLVDVKCKEGAAAAGWSLVVSSSAEVAVKEVELKEAQTLHEEYIPNLGHSLFRVVAAAPEASIAAIHVSCSLEDADLDLRVIRLEHTEEGEGADGATAEVVVKRAAGRGAASIAAVPLEAEAPGRTLILDCRVDELSARRLALPTKKPEEEEEEEAAAPAAADGGETAAPAEGEGEGGAPAAADAPPPITWSLSLVSAAAATSQGHDGGGGARRGARRLGGGAAGAGGEGEGAAFGVSPQAEGWAHRLWRGRRGEDGGGEAAVRADRRRSRHEDLARRVHRGDPDAGIGVLGHWPQVPGAAV